MKNDQPLRLVAPLFVPADRPDRIGKALVSGADAVIVDLEDAVAPENKAHARNSLGNLEMPRQCPIYIRINDINSDWFKDDIAAVVRSSADGIILPKAENAQSIETVLKLTAKKLRVIPLIETAAGLGNLAEVMGVDTVSQVAFGSLDFALDLNCSHTWEALLMARSEIVFRSRIAGLMAPIDGVTTELDDMSVVETDARRALDLGFGGKLAIHPKQVAYIKKTWRPSSEELEWARLVMDAIQDGSVARVNGAMVDRPVIEKARRILEADSCVG